MRTEQFCRESRMKRNIVASSTSLVPNILGTLRHRRYHLAGMSEPSGLDLASERRLTNSRRFHHVANRKSLDSFVFWRTSRTVGAANRLDVSTTFLVATAVRY